MMPPRLRAMPLDELDESPFEMVMRHDAAIRGAAVAGGTSTSPEFLAISAA
jgi:hypothetical protein